MRTEELGTGGARELLRCLPPHTLLSLAQTVTHALVDTHTQDDAVKAIILHSPDLESILRRKAITREILFQYLHQKGISVTTATIKQELIGKVLSLWLDENNHTELATPEPRTEVQTVASGTVAPGPDAQLQTMAHKFVQWFYPLLKECGLHSDNFWENTELLLSLQRHGAPRETATFSGVAQVLGGLAQLARGGVLLQPSAAGGVLAEMDAHGLVLITSCGTVHSRATCGGVYEQRFALAADPYSQGDWRIKRSTLDVRLEGGAPVGLPASASIEGEGMGGPCACSDAR